MKVKKIIAIIIALSVALSSVSVFAATEDVKLIQENENINILVDDAFNNGISTWTKSVAKYFSGVTGKLTYKNLTGGRFADTIVNPQYNVTNGYISFDMKAERTQDFAFMFRINGNNAYYLYFDYDFNKICLAKKHGGKELIIKEANLNLKDNQNYEVGVTLKGTEITISIDSVEYIKATDTDINSGSVGFSAIKGKYEIDNLLIYENKDEVYQQSDKVEQTTKIYVAPDGDDINGNGTYEKPYATMSKAKEMVTIAKGNYLPVEVIFKEGTYRINENTYFTAADSGSEFAPITYRAEEGKKVELTGASVIDHSKFEPVKDEEVLNKLYDHVKGKVLQLDLGAQGYTREELDFTTYSQNPLPTKSLGESNYYGKLNRIQFFLNDRTQPLSMWPNAGYAEIERGLKGSQDKNNYSDGGKIYFSNPEPLRWTEAKDAFVEGLLYYEWHYESIPIKQINLEERCIDLARYSTYGVRDKHEYRVINLVEEIDMPGEWFVDFETMILYYYPEKELTKDDVFEVSTLKQSFISLDGASYINFKDLTFKNNKGLYDEPFHDKNQFVDYGSGIEFGNNAHDIIIDGCTFKDLSGTGVRSIGYRGYQTFWGDTDVYIQNCDFYRCGNNAIRAAAGDSSKLEYGNLNIVNCFFYENKIERGNENSCGVNVLNNLLVRTRSNAVQLKGIEFRIDNNEVVYGSYLDCDSGAIYVGRNVANSGSSISRNLIMDYGPVPENERSFPCGGIYLDDCTGGIKLYQNIAKARGKKIKSTAIIYGGGPDNEYVGNISLDAVQGFIIQNRNSSNQYLNAAIAPLKDRYNANREGWSKKYPETERFLAYIEDYKLYDSRIDIRDNLVTNCNEPLVKTNWEVVPTMTGTVDDAYEINDLSIYNDPENGDYRITMEAKEKYNLPDTLPNVENLDLETIGIQRELVYNDKLVNFDITYPSQGETVPYANKIGFAWQSSDAACHYEYKIATDKEMKNIVATDEILDTFVEITTLEANKTYYITVTAVNTTRKFNYAIENTSGAIEFKTPSVFYSDTNLLETTMAALEKDKKAIKEGTKAGQYKEGTISLINSMLTEANTIVTSKPAQNIVDEMNSKVVNFRNQLPAYANIGYTTVSMSKRAPYEFISKETPVINLSEGKTEITTSAQPVTFAFKEIRPNAEAVKFKYKVSDTKNWHAFGLRLQDGTKHIYNDNCYYMITKADIFELQRSGKIIATAPNNGITVSNKENDVTMVCATMKNGVNIYIEVNGQVIFDYLDTDPLRELKPGKFGVYVGPETTMEISSVTNIPETLFTPSAKIAEQDESGETLTFGTEGTDFLRVSGEWTETTYKNTDDYIELLGTPGAEANIQLNAKGETTYIVSYWHHADSSYDSNVEVIVSGKDGEYRTKVDFTKGEDGYVELGSFKFTDNAAQFGKVTVIFRGSGNGKVPISSYMIKEVSADKYPDMLQKENQ